jgi:xylose isomerase
LLLFKTLKFNHELHSSLLEGHDFDHEEVHVQMNHKLTLVLFQSSNRMSGFLLFEEFPAQILATIV